MIKMYAIFCRETLALFEGNEGKLASQSGHAYLHAYWDAEDRFGPKYGSIPSPTYLATMHAYRNNNDARKIALVVDYVADLQYIHDTIMSQCGVSLVEDCGYTIFKEPTITCLGIGPLDDDAKPDMLKKIPLLRHALSEETFNALKKEREQKIAEDFNNRARGF
jgi:peptidyl-tRNA hydrolase